MKNEQGSNDDGHEPECPRERCKCKTRRRARENLRLVAAGLAVVASLAELFRDFFN